MSDTEVSELQRAKQRISREEKTLQKQLKVDDKTVTYELNGNKIVKVFYKAINGKRANKYSVFYGFKEVTEKKADGQVTGRKVYTPEYLKLKKEGFLK
jgi:hypothetical protein